ncbi:hypothetical protein A7W90_18280 [Clostridium sp. Bc-iso-3]|nr:hypothetical protein A7W90_18280 [Clostridium sp. Bc-iso-3]
MYCIRKFAKNGQTYRYEEVYDYYPDGTLNNLINRRVKVVNQGTPIVDAEIEKYKYTYDEANNQTKKTEYLTGGTRVTDYGYDALNRLETVSESNGRFTVYTYDVAGNRKEEKISQNGTLQIVNTYVYDKQNRLERIETTGVVTQIQSYRYDENGNQIEVRTTTGSTTELTASYSYDLLNRMISATVGGKTVTYTYSGDGLRLSKYVDGTLTKYIYEYDKVVLELDGSGNQVGRNIYGTNLLMRQADGLSLYYLYNGHADVTALVDANTGVLRATYYYDAFGNIEEEKYYDANGNLTTTPINNNIRYAGYQYDEETGLYYLNARMYDPKIARFLQEDTYKGDPNDPLSLNLYVYCRNNPIMYDDPSGHFWHVVGAALLGAVVSAAIDVGTQMIFERKSFKDINWKSVGVSALEGAISGAIASVTGGVSLAAAAGKGAVKTTGKQILKKAVQTAVVEGVVGAAANATAQKIVNNDVDWNEVAISGVADAISGGVGSALSDIKVGKKLLDAGKKVKQKVGDFVSSVGDQYKESSRQHK